MPDLPRHLRRAFEELIRQIEESGYVPDAVFAQEKWGEVETIGGFLAKFVGCKQRLPAGSRLAVEGLYFQRFGRAPPESRFATYSSAARRIAELRHGASALVSS